MNKKRTNRRVIYNRTYRINPKRDFTPAHIQIIKSTLFSGRKIEGVNEVEEFLNGMPQAPKEYTVIFPCRRSEIVARNANTDFIEYKRTLPATLRPVIEPEFLKRHDGQGLLIFKKVEAYDAISARSIAEARLSVAGSFVGFFIHDMHVEIPRYCAVISDQKCEIIPRTKKATLRRQDMRLTMFDKNFDTMLGPFVNNDTDQSTRARLIGAFRAHRSGTHGASEEDQLTNLWTSLETLVGTTPDGNVITQINSICIPILCSTYAESVLGDLVENIRRCIATEKLQIIMKRQVKGENDKNFWLRLVASNELKRERDLIYEEPEALTLLKYRLFRVREMLVTPANALHHIMEHEQRLKWHIERIYRIRNILVHAGQIAGPYLPNLVVNMHSYVDQLITAIVQRLHKEKHRVSLEKYSMNFKLIMRHT